jgi:hypothetical protein
MAAVSFANQSDEGRWLLNGGDYRKQVFARPSPPHGYLKHIEWGGWGWAGQDTTVYLVFDPADNLARGPKNTPGKFNGLPCDGWSVRELQRTWYLVTFYTNTNWKNCNP